MPSFTRSTFVDYERVTFLDNDAFLATTKADDVFEACQADICMAEDYTSLAIDGSELPVGTAGVMVVRPSVETYQKVLEDVNAQTEAHIFPEQGFMTKIFLHEGRSYATLGFFDGSFNGCSKGRLESKLSCKGAADCQAATEKSIKIQHMCGPRPEDKGFNHAPCADEGTHGQCVRPSVRQYQDLWQEVHPNAYSSTCDNMCGSRCLPDELSCSLYIEAVSYTHLTLPTIYSV